MILRDVRIESHCQHHIVPILGVAHVGYLPAARVVGISKLARVVEVLARRMQTQETLKRFRSPQQSRKPWRLAE